MVLQRGATALMAAAESGHVEVAEYLLNRGARVDATDEVSAVALGLA
jgi:hypothetical protein